MKKCRAGVLGILWTVLVLVNISQAATYSTKNFTVTASDPRVAEQMANRAEDLRKTLANFWLGKTMPNWYERCKIKVDYGNKLPGGSTSFSFHKGEVYGWDMQVWGTVERIYDSVLPHEITHTILASHFRTPVPRWADEGAATFTEHEAERAKYRQQLYLALKSNKGIPLEHLFTIEEYPTEAMPLYAHGFSLAEFLIRQRGPHYYVSFVDQCLAEEMTWDELVYQYYGYASLQNLQNDWIAWVRDGMKDFIGSNLVAGNRTTLMKPIVEGVEESNMSATQDTLDSRIYVEDLQFVPESSVPPSSDRVQWNTIHGTECGINYERP